MASTALCSSKFWTHPKCYSFIKKQEEYICSYFVFSYLVHAESRKHKPMLSSNIYIKSITSSWMRCTRSTNEWKFDERIIFSVSLDYSCFTVDWLFCFVNFVKYESSEWKKRNYYLSFFDSSLLVKYIKEGKEGRKKK